MKLLRLLGKDGSAEEEQRRGGEGKHWSVSLRLSLFFCFPKSWPFFSKLQKKNFNPPGRQPAWLAVAAGGGAAAAVTFFWLRYLYGLCDWIPPGSHP